MESEPGPNLSAVPGTNTTAASRRDGRPSARRSRVVLGFVAHAEEPVQVGELARDHNSQGGPARSALITFCDKLGPPHLLSRRHTAHIPAVPNWFLRPGHHSAWRFNDDSGSPADVRGRGLRCRARRNGHRLRGRHLPPRHPTDRTARRPLQHAPGLPAVQPLVGAACGMGSAQLRTRIGRVRPPRHPSPTPSLRIPPARTSLLDAADPRWHGLALSGTRPHPRLGLRARNPQALIAPAPPSRILSGLEGFPTGPDRPLHTLSKTGQ